MLLHINCGDVSYLAICDPWHRTLGIAPSTWRWSAVSVISVARSAGHGTIAEPSNRDHTTRVHNVLTIWSKNVVSPMVWSKCWLINGQESLITWLRLSTIVTCNGHLKKRESMEIESGKKKRLMKQRQIFQSFLRATRSTTHHSNSPAHGLGQWGVGELIESGYGVYHWKWPHQINITTLFEILKSFPKHQTI